MPTSPPPMQKRIQEVTSDLSALATKVTEQFGGFSEYQLNWKPSADSWSVAQCFDHLIKAHCLYFPVFQRLKAGDINPSLWERISPLSGWFGAWLIEALDPENTKKTKTSKKAEPSVSHLGGRIIEQYCEHQDQLIEHVQYISGDINPEKTIITSPLLGFVTYSLDDCFTILVSHGERHFRQAKRVAEVDGFLV